MLLCRSNKTGFCAKSKTSYFEFLEKIKNNQTIAPSGNTTQISIFLLLWAMVILIFIIFDTYKIRIKWNAAKSQTFKFSKKTNYLFYKCRYVAFSDENNVTPKICTFIIFITFEKKAMFGLPEPCEGYNDADRNIISSVPAEVF